MKTVLIVDDNRYILEGLLITLSQNLKDCAVLTAGNGEKALEIVDSGPVDVIMTDLSMPVMDGYRLIEEVRKRFPALPIFVMTADCGSEASRRLRPFGVGRCFEKPFDFFEAARTIAEALACCGSRVSAFGPYQEYRRLHV